MGKQLKLVIQAALSLEEFKLEKKSEMYPSKNLV